MCADCVTASAQVRSAPEEDTLDLRMPASIR